MVSFMDNKKQIIRRIKNYLVYADVDQATYSDVLPNLRASNRKNLVIYSFIAAIAMIAMATVSFAQTRLMANRPYYFWGAFFMLVCMCCAYFLGKKHYKLLYCLMYLFVLFLFAFGIILGTITNPDIPAVSFPVLLFAVPLLFVDRPIRMDIFIILAAVVYIFVGTQTKDTSFFMLDIVNISVYGLLSAIISTYMMKVKVQRFKFEEYYKHLLDVDQLTGLLNRRRYAHKILSIDRTQDKSKYYLVCFDINGLKEINDSVGHIAGDELIKGAANCIKSIFGKHGECYRIGGDEFWAIIESDDEEITNLIAEFDTTTSQWSGTHIKELSISYGVVAAKDYPKKNAEALIQITDEEMYRKKSEYYLRVGKDRRKR